MDGSLVWSTQHRQSGTSMPFGGRPPHHCERSEAIQSHARGSGFNDGGKSVPFASRYIGSHRVSFVARHALWSDEQKEAASRLRRIAEEQKLETIRLSFADQHGILRGKTLVAAEALASLESGCTITTTMLAKDTAHRTVFPVFTAGGGFGMKEMEGAADVLMVPDPTTFRVLPWSPATGWVLCDIYFGDGRPIPFSTRHLYRSVLNKLSARGYEFVAGLEVEFHIFKLD